MMRLDALARYQPRCGRECLPHDISSITVEWKENKSFCVLPEKFFFSLWLARITPPFGTQFTGLKIASRDENKGREIFLRNLTCFSNVDDEKRTSSCFGQWQETDTSMALSLLSCLLSQLTKKRQLRQLFRWKSVSRPLNCGHMRQPKTTKTF